MRNFTIKVSQAKAPGKLILSGEHAVVYQHPAIAMAVNKHVNVKIQSHHTIFINFENNFFEIPYKELPLRIKKIKQRYADYQLGNFDIKAIFDHPSELILLILNDYPITEGLNITLTSDLPIGCGMGASAAVILACFTALNDYFNITLLADELYQCALTIENFQHGKSSGLDIRISQFGGALFIEQSHRTPLNINSQHFFAINSGKPVSTTGQCVEHVKRYQHDTTLWQAFSQTTYAFKQTLEENNLPRLQDIIKENHQLLTRIGIVPEKIQYFIKNIESLGFAAKISGAGSIQGDAAGMVIVAAEDITPLETLCQHYNYQLSSITGELYGARTY